MRAVVTGGAGFIGSHLIEALVARGDEVVCVDREGASRQWIGHLDIPMRLHGLQNPDALAESFAGADVVFHLAGLTAARRVADFYTVNTEGTAHVMRAAARQGDRAPRVVLASSLAALGPNRNGELLGSDMVPRPLSHYGHSKLLAELMLHAWGDRVPGVVLRLAGVYGPRECGVLKLFKLVRHGFALTIGPWGREVSLLYVSDLVQGFLRAATQPGVEGRTFCLAHPAPVSWRQFALEVGQVLGRRPRLISLPRPVGRAIGAVAELVAALGRQVAIVNREKVLELMQRRWVCDVAPAVQDLGFRPAFPLARGIAVTADWYRGMGWV